MKDKDRDEIVGSPSKQIGWPLPQRSDQKEKDPGLEDKCRHSIEANFERP